MNSPPQYKHIIWDWNGTLLNDGWLFVDVMNTVLKRHELESITLEKYREIFGFPVKDYYKKLGFDFEKEPFEESGLEFIRGYENRRYDAKLYPQVISLLTELREMGISHSILSAQHQSLLNDLTDYYKIRDQFIGIFGLDNHYAHSKVENGIKWVKQLDMNPQEILMIGDTDHDFEVATAMGVDCILLSHGHHSKSRLQNTGAKVLYNLSDISKLFNIELNKINEKRVFIGIPIGANIKPILSVLKSKFTQYSENIKWIPSENIHLTLKFLGNISVNDLPILIQSLKKELTQNSFAMVIESTGVFPSSHSPRALWLGIKRGAEELISLHTQIEKSLGKITAKNPELTFTPHITIAKIPQNFVKIDVLPFLNTVYSPIELDVNSICLFESQLFQEGAKYRILNEFPLNR